VRKRRLECALSMADLCVSTETHGLRDPVLVSRYFKSGFVSESLCFE
jgi:hypothetical protein